MIKTLKALFIAGLIIISGLLKAQDPVHPTKVTTAHYHDVYGPLSNIAPATKAEREAMQNKAEAKMLNPKLENRVYPYQETALPKGEDGVWQKNMGTSKSSRSPIVNVEGQSSPYYPPDCNASVGPNHVMQTVNTTYAIYDKNGTQVVSPTAMNTLFSGVPGATNNDGDPLILFDNLADRWLAVEFSISGSPDYMLFAVSQTNDPTGTWDRWSFVMSGMPDYEKVGIWPDGYYMSTNTTSGDDVYVFERDVMVTGGNSPQMVQFNNPWRPNTIDGFHAILPLDNDGPAAPSGSPGLYITINDDAIGGGNDELWIYECDVDWTTPSNSTFTRTQQLSVEPFDSNFGNTWSNIVQPGTSNKLDAIPMILMYRAQYRNFGSSQAIVCNHTVDLDGTNHAGIRWYELENTGSSWSIRQQGTYGPDSHNRWMGSIAMNGSHEIGLGYSISSSTVYPGIRYVGQTAGENAAASGILDATEEVIIEGSNVQTSYNRWGDYANIAVDPVDDETFWFSSQYPGSGGARKTKIASFQIGPAVLAANFTADATQIEVGNAVQFTDLSTGSPTSWTWTFPGGSPSSYNGQTPPPIQYSAIGDYDVTLEVSDGTGTDILTKTAYIHVVDCGVSTFPFTEGFEAGSLPQCWTEEYVTGSLAWAYLSGNGGNNPSSAHSGSFNACFKDESSSSDKTMLITPELDLSSFGTAWVTFWHTQQFWSPDQDELSVYYRTSASGTWNLLHTYTSSISSWTKDSLDLPNINGTYYIAFQGDAMYGYGVCLDDITVNGQGSAVIVADFSAQPLSGDAPLSVDFHDQSSGNIDSWSWDFGDGNTSTEQFPTNIYTAAGLYTVSLTVSGPDGSATETKTDYIDVTALVAPVAEFEGTPTSGNVPLTVDFADLSTGTVDSWAWDFGDGNTSTDQNPQHVYNSVGTYTVSLTVTGPGGNSTETKADYITVNPIGSPVADFSADPLTGDAPLTVSFTDLSTGQIDLYTWEFGDGGNSNEANPSYTFLTPGTYTVTLTVSGPGGSDSEVKTDYITVNSIEAPVADFSATPTTGSAPLAVSFTNLSTGSILQYDWQFGDGQSSQDTDPVHTYVNTGSYTVTLTVTGPGGSSTETKTDYILIPVGIGEHAGDAITVYPNPAENLIMVDFPDARLRTLRLINGQGITAFTARVIEQSTRLNISLLPSGPYWLQVIDEGQIVGTLQVLKK